MKKIALLLSCTLLMIFQLSAQEKEITGKTGKPVRVHYGVPETTPVATRDSKPVIIWLSPDQPTSTVLAEKMTVRVGVNSTAGIASAKLYVNGREPNESRGLGTTSLDATKFDSFIEREITLSAGANEIKVVAANQNNEVATESRIVNFNAPALATSTRTDYALIIATNDYNDWGDLTNPVFDATTIANELEENYGFKVERLFNKTKSEILTKIIEYNKKNYLPDDQLFIFIAGHGKFDENIKDGYLVCKDSKKNDPTSESYIPYSYLKTAIDNNPSRHIFFVMDACFGGTFDQAIAKRGEDDEGGMYAQISPEEYIAKKLKYKTRIYLTSGGKEYVPDGRPNKHSPFAFYFIDALRSYGGRNKVLTTQEIWLNVEATRPEPRFGTFGDNEPGSEFVFQAR